MAQAREGRLEWWEQGGGRSWQMEQQEQRPELLTPCCLWDKGDIHALCVSLCADLPTLVAPTLLNQYFSHHPTTCLHPPEPLLMLHGLLLGYTTVLPCHMISSLVLSVYCR